MVDTTPTRDASLTINESDMILKSTLLSQHYGDPVILRFIDEYLRTLSVPLAAKAAGVPLSAGRSIMRLSDVNNAIGKLSAKSAAKGGFKAQALIEGIENMNDIDIFDLLDEDGCVLPKEQLPRELRLAVREFEVVEEWATDMNDMPLFDSKGKRVRKGRVVKVKMYDKLKTAELLGRVESTFISKTVVEHDIGKNAGQILHGEAMERSQARRLQMRDVTEALPAPGGTDVASDNDAGSDTEWEFESVRGDGTSVHLVRIMCDGCLWIMEDEDDRG